MDFLSPAQQAQQQQMANLQNQLAGMLQSFQNINQSKSPQIGAQMQPQKAIEFVNGLDGARNYLKDMPRNSSAAVFDRNESVFYTLSVDANGVAAPIKRCPFTIEDIQDEKPDIITRKDLDDFEARIMTAIANSNRQQRQNNSNPNQNKGGNQQ